MDFLIFHPRYASWKWEGSENLIGDDNVQMLKMNRKLGYHFQYTRNMLQLNNAGNNFTETALNGCSYWLSWSALFDYDQDGEQDLCGNGIQNVPMIWTTWNIILMIR
jgi:hypothetical protein